LIALRLGLAAVAIVSAGAALCVLALRLRGVWYPPLAPEVALLAAALASLGAGLLRALPDRLIAASADRRLGLRDRIGSALQFLQAGAPSGMERAAVLDALGHLDALRARDAFPMRRPRGASAAAVCLGTLLLAQLLPIPPLLLSPREREEKAELREVAARIEPLAKQLEQAAAQADDHSAAQLSTQLRKLAQQLQRGQVTKKQALLDLGELEKKVQRLDQKLAKPKTAEELADSLRQAQQEAISRKASELARQAAERGDKEAAKQLQQLAQQAKQADDQQQLNDLSRRLEERAAKLGASLGLPPGLLGALSQSLAGADPGLSEQALQHLAEAAKDWPKELSKEELEALAAELKDLSKQLDGSDLKELSKLLSEASECLKSGKCDKAGAALGKAAKLAKGALAKARLAAVCRSCKLGLGQCSGKGTQIVYGRGGPAPQKAIPPNAPGTQLFAPRQSENPGDLERVRAQINPQAMLAPRGPMLATTEKGAPPLGGPSRVPYYEVISDYSKTAEEALAKEEVPPAYRGTVRDYFRALQSGKPEKK
jgi:uncharacterized protein YjgD (DUF1641 family)